jgi:hypothetical protein
MVPFLFLPGHSAVSLAVHNGSFDRRGAEKILIIDPALLTCPFPTRELLSSLTDAFYAKTTGLFLKGQKN